jgi:crotonobetainyl-CoA:carnitine CoA-transferase CaiB-like acyl-CoA transferase
MKLPLEGIKVIDLSVWMFGTVGAAHLADMGADVIKVENPRGGDPGRGLLSSGVVPMGDWNMYFGNNNRNKKSLAINLHKPKGREVVYKLVETADVFSSNMQREPLERMGVDYASISRINPKIIYALASGFGRHGPARDYPAHDTDGQARAGIMPTLGEPGRPPVYTGSATGDAVGALTLAWSIVTALFHRERTGIGQEVDVSLFGSQIMFEAATLSPYLATRDASLVTKESRKDAHNPLYNIYPAQDKWVFLGMVDEEAHWADFCKGLGRPELAGDPRFDSQDKRFGESRRALIDLLDELLPARTAAEWLESWKDLGIIAEPVNSFVELAKDPQALLNECIVEYEHPAFNTTKMMMGFPAQFSKAQPSIRMPEPELGQHTEEILLELGYTWDDIGELKSEGLIL